MKENKYLQWLSKTDSVYWNDSAIFQDQQISFANGAVGITTNPFLVNASLQSNRIFWKDKLKNLPKGLKGDEKAESLIGCVAGFYADLIKDTYHNGKKGEGYVCAQTNPNKSGDTLYMLNQAKRYASIAENIVIKIPATASGIAAFEECAALGINVAATVSFTVPQVLAVARAGERGKKRALQNGIKPGLTIAVLMVGRLDDYIRDVAQDMNINVFESDMSKAGTACIKRAYKIFRDNGFSTLLMPAGCRCAEHISDLAGANMIMSIAPKIAVLLEDNDVFEEKIDIPVANNTIDNLMKIGEFRKAYEPDGMKPQDFITFGPVNRTISQFIECGWNQLAAFEYDN